MHNLAVFHDYTWTAFAIVFTLLAALSALNYLLPSRYCWRRSKLALLVFPASCTFSYFVIAALIYWGVVVERQVLIWRTFIQGNKRLLSVLLRLGFSSTVSLSISSRGSMFLPLTLNEMSGFVYRILSVKVERF